MKEKHPKNQPVVELPELLRAESSIPLPSPEDFPGLLLDENVLSGVNALPRPGN